MRCPTDNHYVLGDGITDKLSEILNEIGVSRLHPVHNCEPKGFPHSIPNESGEHLLLDLASPALINSLDPDQVGIAVLDILGFPISLWGLATKVPHFSKRQTIIDTPIAGLLEGSFEGKHGAIYYRGIRFFASHVSEGGIPHVVILVINANEESEIRKESQERLKAAETLKRLGKALIMNQTCEPLCVAATHEISSAADLAAVLLWVVDPDKKSLELTASVGVNRQGTATMRSLSLDSAACFAEIAASTRTPIMVKCVTDHMMSAQLEANICYLRPQGLYVCPLEISGNLVGVLELIGKTGDRTFVEKEQLFETIGEHLALAVSGATVFENFQRLACIDALTGLYNHRSMQETLHQMVVEAEKAEECLSALLIDVDHFHFFNEEEGHDAGDLVLKSVADILKYSTRGTDLVARYGGEEFVVLMPRLTLDEALAIGERIRLRVAAATFESKTGKDLHITVSVGCSSIPESSTDGAGLLRAADTALYAAKRSGRNRVCVFDGASQSEERRQNFSVERLKVWFSNEEWEKEMIRLKKQGREISMFSAHLHLNPAQREILQGLFVIAPRYLGACYQRDQVLLQRMNKSEEFRLLMPSLTRLNDRFDEIEDRTQASKRLPLLARLLQVLLAVESGVDLTRDPGKFDPHLVELALIQNAA